MTVTPAVRRKLAEAGVTALVARNPGAAAKACLCPLLLEAWGGHETPVADRSIRMAARQAQRGGGVLLTALQQLLLLLLLQPLLLGGSWLACGAATAPAASEVAKEQTPEELRGAPPNLTLAESRRASADTVSERVRRRSSQRGVDKEDLENLELLRSAMADADATETEKPTDSQYL